MSRRESRTTGRPPSQGIASGVAHAAVPAPWRPSSRSAAYAELGITGGILGACGSLALGGKWLSDLQTEEVQLARAFSDAIGSGAEYAALEKATYALLVCGVIGLVASILVLARRLGRWPNAILLLLAGLAPLGLSLKAMFGVPMLLAGLLAFFVKYDRKAPPPAPQGVAKVP